jgi:hypothetical protein
VVFGIIVGFLTRITIHGSLQKPRHLGNKIAVAIVKVQIISPLLIGTDINESVLMFFGHNVDLVIGKVRLKLLDFIGEILEPNGFA